MDQPIAATGLTIKSMDAVTLSGMIIECIMVNGMIIICMELVYTFMPMVLGMKANILKIKSMGMACISGRTRDFMKAGGTAGGSMASEFTRARIKL